MSEEEFRRAHRDFKKMLHDRSSPETDRRGLVLHLVIDLRFRNVSIIWALDRLEEGRAEKEYDLKRADRLKSTAVFHIYRCRQKYSLVPIILKDSYGPHAK